MTMFEMFQMIGTNIWFYGGAFLLVLGVLVFVHEWGHYIVARMCGVRVEHFSIGFGKEIWGFNDKNGTRWKVSLIPLGGYVKLFGDTDPASAGHTDEVENDKGEIRLMTEAEKKEAFFTKPVLQRAAIVFAGPAINYIFAVMVLTGLYLVEGQPVQLPVASAIMGDSAAAESGFEPHDKIISIDGKSVESFQDIRREMMIALDLERTFKIQRGDEVVTIKTHPKRVEMVDRFGFKSSIGVLGLLPSDQALDITKIIKIDGVAYENAQVVAQKIAENMGKTFKVELQYGTPEEPTYETMIIHPVADMNKNFNVENAEDANILFLSNQAPKVFLPHTPMTAVQSAIRQTYVITRDSLGALGQMITGTRSATELGGIIRIGAIAGDMAQQGIVALVLLTALLSVNLGFINLLPIPLLDGGHLMFYFFESLLGRPVPEVIQEYAFRAGMVFLIGIMAFANINDLIQLFGILD